METIDNQKYSKHEKNRTEKEIILSVNDVKKWFPINEQSILFSKTVAFVKAVNGISFDLYKGETLGLVGESGCGKSTLAKLIMGLEEVTEGVIEYRNKNVNTNDELEKRIYKGNVQMIFQDPFSSLNPRMTIYDILKEPYLVQEEIGKKMGIDELIYSEDGIKERIMKLLNVVGLENYHALRYPHEFSGGQRQRVGIARSLAMSPEIIVADEPVSALDVSIQAQILNLLKEIQGHFDLTYLFIAHDLSVVKHVSDRILVMYLGKAMELAPRDVLYEKPSHPYTISLLSAIPRVNPKERKDRIILEGDVPSPISPPSGCVFSSRCYKVQDKCKTEVPEFKQINKEHFVACFYPENI